MTVIAGQQDNIFDLTAQESAWLGVPHASLLIKAFKAIDKDYLPACFPKPSPTVLVVKPGTKWWRPSIKQAIFALEQNPHFFVPWFRFVLVNVSDYACWREAATTLVPPPRPAPTSAKKVLEGMKAYRKSECAAGRKGSQKRAWEWAKAAMPGCTYRQVIDALAAAEGGKKARGRPRKALPDNLV